MATSHPFGCPHCSASFSTKTGLGVHKKRKHPLETNEEVNTDRIKARWSSEELSLMAFKEVELINSGWTAEINSSLMLLFPNRSREAIKGQRKSKKYKDLLAGLRHKTAPQSSCQASSAHGPAPSDPHDSKISNVSASSSLRRSKRNLTKSSNSDPRNSCDNSSSSDILPAISEVYDPNLNPGRQLRSHAKKLIPIRSVSSTDSDEDVEPLVLHSVELDSPDRAPLQTINEDLELLQEIRADLDTTSTSMLELSAREPLIPVPAFTLTSEESRLADHLDCLFNSDVSSTFSQEFKEIWTDFRRRPCKETLFLRTNLFLQVLLPDKSETQRPRRVPRNDPQRGIISKRRQRRQDYAKTQESFRRNPSRCANQILDPVDPGSATSHFDDDFRSFWENVFSLPRDHKPSFPVLPRENDMDGDSSFSALFDPISLEEVQKSFPRNQRAPGPDRHLLENTVKLLAGCNLKVNLGKSFTISIVADGPNKKTKVDGTPRFKVGPSFLRPLSINEQFKYLGVKFSAQGLLVADCAPALNKYLSNLTSAPLKPQQRLYILRTILLPKLFHLLVLSNVRAGHLVKLDSCARAFVRRVLYLPTDCPNAYLYAAISDGGLGVPCLRYSVPVWRAARLTSLSTSMTPACLAGAPGEYLQRLRERAARGLLTGDVNKFFAAKFYNSVDGLA
ncbi:Retrovirus-related Pol polyprotein from type-2 retrotransposable element R2DM [Araneus ventricosus]|uniref:Retrovirus-related Pol polyprotein from type-2 retrotransposable element R2DM n=1 Tax=Araneus ventricosus TaxID=182803 RepID=A0A4Y2BVP5_ARAVE|nr:Retrovirus-related Pol polyprotein from type-2 retrotransposable element R2DM [Araneus ventricosus]